MPFIVVHEICFVCVRVYLTLQDNKSNWFFILPSNIQFYMFCFHCFLHHSPPSGSRRQPGVGWELWCRDCLCQGAHCRTGGFIQKAPAASHLLLLQKRARLHQQRWNRRWGTNKKWWIWLMELLKQPTWTCHNNQLYSFNFINILAYLTQSVSTLWKQKNIIIPLFNFSDIYRNIFKPSLAKSMTCLCSIIYLIKICSHLTYEWQC